MRNFLLFIMIFLSCFESIAQNAIVQGTVLDLISRKPLENVTVQIQNTEILTTSDREGRWTLELTPGLKNIEFRHVGFESQIVYENRIRIAQTNQVDVELFPKTKEIDEVTISTSFIARSAENGNNVKTLEIDEIQRMPGAVMDISKVIKNFPGVSPRVSFGYNIIVRGGGSFENKFYLDGIEIPAITHFSVQGLSGGPNGSINTDLISRVTFKNGSFPVNRGNSLSSVMELEQKAGRTDRFGAKLTLGAAEYGAHIEGPMTKNSSYILSFRKSYTEYLLKAFDLPVLPAFSDFQYKHQIKLANNDRLTLVGLGTFDQYRLNLDAEDSDVLAYNTGYIPEGDQNTIVLGAHYKHFTDKGVFSIVASNTNFRNTAEKYYDNSQLEEDLSLNYNSTENETKFQVENKIYNSKSTFSYGVSYDFVDFSLSQYSIYSTQDFGVDTLDFSSNIKYQKYGIFSAYSYDFSKKWNAYIGLRVDGNSFGEKMKNPFSQISPRASLQYKISPRLSATVQAGIYYQLPPNVLLGYLEEGELVNQEQMDYMKSNQVSTGLNYQFSKERSISVDLFYKSYSQYPFLLRDSISFANASGEYVSVGNQRANSDSQGQAYGVEFFFQQKLHNNWFANVSSSYIISEFENKEGDLVPSAWDNRFAANLTLGRELRKNWTLGAKFTYAGASPYTEYDQLNSSQIVSWDAYRRGVPNLDRLNGERLPAFHSLDFRVDKKWYRKNMTIIAFLDIQNLYNNKFQQVPYLIVNRDETGANIIDSEDSSRYETSIINSDTGRVLPTIGFSVEF